MLIDTRTKESIETSLAGLLDISIDELYQYVDYAAYKARSDHWGFNTDVFEEEILNIVSDLQPEEIIDEMYVYHLSRRLENHLMGDASDNLKSLLLNESPLSDFLKKYEIQFIDINGHPTINYKNRILELTDTFESDVCYLRGRLGYDEGIEDYCFNGFALRDQLMKNSYTRELYRCPEFIGVLSRFLKNDKICEDYFNSSKYYCYTYKLRVSEIIFDDRDTLSDEEKVNYFIVQLFMRLLAYTGDTRYMHDHDNPIIRVDDNVCVSAELLIEKEEILEDMMK